MKRILTIFFLNRLWWQKIYNLFDFLVIKVGLINNLLGPDEGSVEISGSEVKRILLYSLRQSEGQRMLAFGEVVSVKRRGSSTCYFKRHVVLHHFKTYSHPLQGNQSDLAKSNQKKRNLLWTIKTYFFICKEGETL